MNEHGGIITGKNVRALVEVIFAITDSSQHFWSCIVLIFYSNRFFFLKCLFIFFLHIFLNTWETRLNGHVFILQTCYGFFISFCFKLVSWPKVYIKTCLCDKKVELSPDEKESEWSRYNSEAASQLLCLLLFPSPEFKWDVWLWSCCQVA